MAITTLDGFIAAPKQMVRIVKTSSQVGLSIGFWHSNFATFGQPGGGTLAGTSTTMGVVPTDATAGCPPINTFGGGATGYITQVSVDAINPCRLMLADMLWKGGAYAFNANTSGNTPTSYSSRVPSGTDFTGCELWYEQVTAATGTQTVNVTYTNEAGTTGRSTGVVSTASANTVGRMFPLPLAAGDKGVQGVTGVVGAGASAGTFNILVLHRIWGGRVRIANDFCNYSMDMNGMPTVYDTSALVMLIAADTTTAPSNLNMSLTIANG
jgi:hypothetical protein